MTACFFVAPLQCLLHVLRRMPLPTFSALRCFSTITHILHSCQNQKILEIVENVLTLSEIRVLQANRNAITANFSTDCRL